MTILTSCASSGNTTKSDSGYARKQSWNESSKKRTQSVSTNVPAFSLPILWWTW